MATTSHQSCNTCNIRLNTTFNDHVMTRKHQQLAHKHRIMQLKEQCGIYVNGLPNLIPGDEITKFFAEKGELSYSIIGAKHRFAIFEYVDPEVAKSLREAGKLVFKGTTLNIRTRKPNSDNIGDGGDDRKENFDSVEKLLRKQPDFDRELIQLQRHLKPVDNSLKYRSLCLDLRQCLERYFPGCVVYPFGSTITGLDFYTSDVDLFVHVPYIIFPALQRLPPDELASRFVRMSFDYLLAETRRFTNVMKIPGAKTPIVKFLHIPGGIACDVNFKNMLGVCNSYLIKSYIQTSPRILPVLVILKYWGKVHDLTGKGRFTSYSIVMLFIFFLQQAPYNLPNVRSLQVNHQPNIQDDWDGGFRSFSHLTNKVLNKLPIPEILYKFFEFCVNFNYKEFVISPYLGTTINKSAFLDPATLPASLDRYRINLAKTNTALQVELSICVQDPFEHCHNITRGVQVTQLDDFITFCKQGAAIFHPTVTEPRLYKLFSDTDLSDDWDKCEFTLNAPRNLAFLENKDDTTKATQFIEFVNEFVLKVLMSVYMFDVNIIPSPPNSNKSQKLDNQSDVHDSENETVCFSCSGNVNVWICRKFVSKDLPKKSGENVLEREIRLSKYILEDLCTGYKTLYPIVEFNITMTPSLKPLEVTYVFVSDVSCKHAFKELSTFFTKQVKILYIAYVTYLNSSVEKKDCDVDEKKDYDVDEKKDYDVDEKDNV